MDRRLRYKSIEVFGIEVFYREAGTRADPSILLLHGFPSASHMFRDLIPMLAPDFHLVAPDMPGFGYSRPSTGDRFAHTFDSLARTIDGFVERLALSRFVLYLSGYGAPVGLRVAMRRPDCVAAIISQGGNAYLEGMSDAFAPLQAYWSDPENRERRDALRGLLEPDATERRYMLGAVQPEKISPDGLTLDKAYLESSGAAELQLDLFLDYASNVALYDAFQAYFRARRPPLLAIWGKHDPCALPAGAEAFRRDLPDAQLCLLETGHFALETHCHEVATAIRRFLKDRPQPG